MEEIRAVFRQTPDSDRQKVIWSKRRIFESLDASTTKNLDRIKDKGAAIKLLSEIDEWENEHAAPESKRKRYKRKRKERKQAERALAKMEREAGEKVVDEVAIHAKRGNVEEWLGKQDEPMGAGKGKGKAVIGTEDSYSHAEDKEGEDENDRDSLS
jgi:hypothetical protein